MRLPSPVRLTMRHDARGSRDQSDRCATPAASPAFPPRPPRRADYNRRHRRPGSQRSSAFPPWCVLARAVHHSTRMIRHCAAIIGRGPGRADATPSQSSNGGFDSILPFPRRWGMAAVCALLPLPDVTPGHRRKTRIRLLTTFLTASVIPFQPSGGPTDRAPNYAQGSMLRPRCLAVDRADAFLPSSAALR
jgi:hypothetical protein